MQAFPPLADGRSIRTRRIDASCTTASPNLQDPRPACVRSFVRRRGRRRGQQRRAKIPSFRHEGAPSRRIVRPCVRWLRSTREAFLFPIRETRSTPPAWIGRLLLLLLLACASDPANRLRPRRTRTFRHHGTSWWVSWTTVSFRHASQPTPPQRGHSPSCFLCSCATHRSAFHAAAASATSPTPTAIPAT